MSNETLSMTVEHQVGRIDKVITEYFSQYTRTTVQHWLKQQLVAVNQLPVKSNYKVKKGDTITICIPKEEEITLEKENIPLDILFEDADILVVNKPSGMVVHPSKNHYSGTLVNGLLYHLSELSLVGESNRPGIVHRIDKDTSGSLVIAKTNQAHVGLAKQLEDHTMKRIYIALVEGVIEHAEGTINAPLARDTHNRLKRSVQKDGKPAITHFKVIQRFKDKTLVQLQLETGRTHQIRAHMEYIGHPLVNDPMYHPQGKVATEFGQYLHAETLGFIHPVTQEWLEFTVEKPHEFQETLTELQKELVE